MHSELLQVGADRDGDVIVAALSQGLALLLSHADHAIQLSLDADLLVQRIHAREESIHDVSADYGHIGAIVLIILVEPAPSGQIKVENGSHGRRQTAHPRVADRLLAIFHVAV